MPTNEYGTTAGSSYTLSIGAHSTNSTPSTPSGLIVTAAAVTMQGWFGQVFVDKVIVWESAPQKTSEAAVRAANRKVIETVQGMFGWTGPDVDADGVKVYE